MHLPHLAGGELAAAQVLRVYLLRSCKQPAVAQALALHFEAEDHHMTPRHGSGTGQVEGKGRLPHRRTGSKDVQVAALPARRNVVQSVKTRRDTRNTVASVLHTLLHLGQRVVHQPVYGAKVVGYAALVLQPLQQSMGFHQNVVNIHRLVGTERQQLLESRTHDTPRVQLPKDERMILQMSTGADLRADA